MPVQPASDPRRAGARRRRAARATDRPRPRRVGRHRRDGRLRRSLLHLVGWGTLIGIVAPKNLSVGAPGLRHRPRHHRVHPRHAARLRRRPHRGHRQHHPQADGRRASGRSRSASGSPSGTPVVVFGLCFLLALGVKALAGQVEDDGSALQQTTGLIGTASPASSSSSSASSTSSSSSRSSACSGAMRSGDFDEVELDDAPQEPRLHEPLPRRRHQGGHASRGTCTRSACSSGSASTRPPRSRCSCWRAARRRSSCPGTRSSACRSCSPRA